MNLKSLLLAGVFLLSSSLAFSAEPPSISETDRIRLAEAFRLADAISDKIWPGWKKTPFAVILVTEDHEFLIRHPRPSGDFVSLGHDELLDCEVFYRKRQFPTSFLATFPAVGGLSTVVVGRAENTYVKTSASWVVTLLHEHFHQFQESGPDYFKEVEALDLSGGDTSGMWMINYKFPYEREDVGRVFSEMTALLLKALDTKDDGELKKIYNGYSVARQKLRKIVSEPEFRYFEFQMWKEGIARYTEHRVAEMAAKEYEPSPAFKALEDFESFETVAKQRNELIRNELKNGKISEFKRVLFYPVGGAEGLLLDRIRPGWQATYFEKKFSMGKFFE